MEWNEKVDQGKNFLVQQVYEVAEHFGFETRNKYQILDTENAQVLFAAEQQKGLLGFFLRQRLGHWRPFTLHFYNSKRQQVMTANHPFRFFFQRLEIFDDSNRKIGALQQRFSLFRRKFELVDEREQVLLTMQTKFKIFLVWHYPFFKGQQKVASVDKKFSGIFTEMYTDKDNFLVQFDSPSLNYKEKLLILASSLFIDLLYFETKD